MADEQDRPVLERDRPLDGSDVVREGRQRILDRDDVQAGLLQDWDDLGPTRSIRPRAVDEDHVSHRAFGASAAAVSAPRTNSARKRQAIVMSASGLDTAINAVGVSFAVHSQRALRAMGAKGYVMVARAGFAPAIPQQMPSIR